MFGRRGSQPQNGAPTPAPAPAPVAEPVVAPAEEQAAPPLEDIDETQAESVEATPPAPQPEPAPTSAPAPELQAPQQNPTAALFADQSLDGYEEEEEEEQGKPSDADNSRLADIKITVFNDLLEAVDLAELTKLEANAVKEEISDMTAEIISMRRLVLSVQEQQQVVSDICNDILGLGPLEPLIERDGIADIMVNGAEQVFIEVGGKIELTDIKFRDNAQLMNIC